MNIPNLHILNNYCCTLRNFNGLLKLKAPQHATDSACTLNEIHVIALVQGLTNVFVVWQGTEYLHFSSNGLRNGILLTLIHYLYCIFTTVLLTYTPSDSAR